MGIFSSLLGIDAHEAALNTVLAQHLIDTTDDATRLRIMQRIGFIQASMRLAPDARSALVDLDEQTPVTKYNFVALACNNLLLSPTLKGFGFYDVVNPYRVGTRVNVEHLQTALATVVRSHPHLMDSWSPNAGRISFPQLLDNDGRLAPFRASVARPPARSNMKTVERPPLDSLDGSREGVGKKILEPLRMLGFGAVVWFLGVVAFSLVVSLFEEWQQRMSSNQSNVELVLPPVSTEPPTESWYRHVNGVPEGGPFKTESDCNNEKRVVNQNFSDALQRIRGPRADLNLVISAEKKLEDLERAVCAPRELPIK